MLLVLVLMLVLDMLDRICVWMQGSIISTAMVTFNTIILWDMTLVYLVFSHIQSSVSGYGLFSGLFMVMVMVILYPISLSHFLIFILLLFHDGSRLIQFFSFFILVSSLIFLFSLFFYMYFVLFNTLPDWLLFRVT